MSQHIMDHQILMGIDQIKVLTKPVNVLLAVIHLQTGAVILTVLHLRIGPVILNAPHIFHVEIQVTRDPHSLAIKDPHSLAIRDLLDHRKQIVALDSPVGRPLDLFQEVTEDR